MNEQKKQVNIVITNKPIATSVDGNNIRIQNNEQVEINFFQIIQQHDNTIDAIGTASVRMSLAQLEQFVKTASMAIEDSKKKKQVTNGGQ
ncbi:MAG: hypothetical protein WCV50_01930 [Patescibacteria group bacterium]